MVDSNFGVNGNVIIKGGLHVDGELSINHITAPKEIQETEGTMVYGTTDAAKVIGRVYYTGLIFWCIPRYGFYGSKLHSHLSTLS